MIGDLNARTANLSDVVHDSDIYNPDYYFSDDADLYIPVRASTDNIVNSNGRRLLSLCKSTNHTIANGRLHDDVSGRFTYCCARGMSVVDYLLKSADLSSIIDFKILNDSIFSDHRCLHCTLQRKQNKRSPKKFSNDYVNKIIFNKNKEDIFVQLIRENIDDFAGMWIRLIQMMIKL